MALHISLPQDMENRINDAVKIGMYNSADEIICRALREFLPVNAELTPQETTLLREEMAQRQTRLANGEDYWVDGEAFFKEMTKRYGE